MDSVKISYNYMIPFDAIPDDLVPLTAYFKQLLAMATAEQPLMVFLDSVDQIGRKNRARPFTVC